MLNYAMRILGVLSAFLLSMSSVHADEVPSDKPLKVTILTTGFVMSHKLNLFEEAAEKQGVELQWSQVDLEDRLDVIAALEGTSFVIVDSPRKDDQAKVKKKAGKLLADVDVPKVHINRMTRALRLQVMDAPAEVGQTIHDYYLGGMSKNRELLFAYIKAYVKGEDISKIEPPVALPNGGIYHPDFPESLFSNLEDYLIWWNTHAQSDWKDQSVIAVETSSSYISDGQTRHLDALIQSIEAKGAVPLVHYRASRVAQARKMAKVNQPKTEEDELFPNPKVSKRPFKLNEPLITYQGQVLPNVMIVNAFLGGDVEGRKLRYQAMGIPVMNVVHYKDADYKGYLEDNVGISTFSIPFRLVNPEYIGIQDPVVLTVNQYGEMFPVSEQVELMIGKAVNLAKLQTKSNADKKLSLLFWNHPPGEKNQGASNMNVPRSLEKLVKDLKAEGYQLDELSEQQMIDAVATMLRPAYRKNEVQNLMKTELWDFMPLATYRAWFATLPESVQKDMNTHWGDAENNAWVVEYQGEKGFVIPRLKLGNLIILPQPNRGGSTAEEDKDLFHDTKKPMNHYYAAAYLWLREVYNSDAIIHFGTHGTQEWHPGKERGLWAYDYSNIAVWTTPIIYPYIVDNMSEAVHAKRRGRALILSHQTPAFSPAGLSDDFVAINNMIREYEMLDEGLVKTNNQNLIIEQAIKMNVHKDLDWSVAELEKRFPEFLRDIQDYLEDLGSAMQPLGLHTYGETAADEHLALNVMLILGESLMNALKVENPRQLFVADYKDIKTTEPYLFVLNHIVHGKPLPEPHKQHSALVKEGQKFSHNLKAELETQAMIKALNARWIDPSYGGDPIRNPDAMPTGRNLYGFDPTRVPTKAAYEAGVQALNELVLAHQAKHKKYPEKLAFAMRSTETVRHLGMLEAQIFAALGVKPIWDRGGRVTGVELIPADKLARPRIDAVISITGLYRDQYPNVMERFNEAIALVSKAEESAEQNPIRANTQRVRADLIAQGVDRQLADEFALTRIFSSQNGEYGTKVPEATLASDKWEPDDGKMAELYLKRMSWGYGPNTENWGSKITNTDGQEINVYAQHLKGTDAAVMSRSSNLRGLLDNCHSFEYLGSISMAVKHLDGVSPQLYISNMRDPRKAKLQTAERFMAMELRSVYQHPNWVKEMQKEGYSGTLSMLNTINNFWGWQVVDRNVVRDDQWQEFHEVYIKDKYNLDMKQWFEESNPTAMAQIAERMLEAIRKDYWKASEQTKKELVQVYEELAQKYDVHTDNETFKAYVAELSAGYGLSASPAPDAATSAVEPVAVEVPEQPENSESTEQTEKVETVQGQVMQEQKPESQEPIDEPKWWLLLLALMTLGVMRQIYLRNLKG